MKKGFISAIIFVFLLSFGSLTSAQGPVGKTADEGISFSLGPDVGYLTGHTLYHFSFPVNERFGGLLLTEAGSELEFPLDSPLGGISASLGRKGVWSIDLSVAMNLNGDTGKTKDSDFATIQDISTGETESGLIIYSESDTDMDAFLLDLNGRYYFLRKNIVALGLVAGYRYQDFSFDISNVDQVDILGSHIFVPGKAATYEIKYNIPYGGIALNLSPSDRFSMNFLGAYGWAFSKDEDDHILRSKKSTASADGPFYLLKAQANLTLIKNLLLQAALEYLKIDADGTQDQVRYAATSEGPAGQIASGITYKAESEQTYVWVGLKYIFN